MTRIKKILDDTLYITLTVFCMLLGTFVYITLFLPLMVIYRIRILIEKLAKKVFND